MIMPSLFYRCGMPLLVVVGISLFQCIFVTASLTCLQPAHTQAGDGILALILLTGAVMGAQVGTRAGTRLRGEQLRILLAMLVLAVCSKLLFDLVSTPPDLFSIGAEGGH